MNIAFSPVADLEAPLAGAMLAFDNSFARLPETFYTRLAPTALPDPYLVAASPAAAALLGLDPQDLGRGATRSSRRPVSRLDARLGRQPTRSAGASVDPGLATGPASVAVGTAAGATAPPASRRRTVAERFIAEFTKTMAGLVVGPGLSEGVQLGASVSMKERNKMVDDIPHLLELNDKHTLIIWTCP